MNYIILGILITVAVYFAYKNRESLQKRFKALLSRFDKRKVGDPISAPEKPSEPVVEPPKGPVAPVPPEVVAPAPVDPVPTKPPKEPSDFGPAPIKPPKAPKPQPAVTRFDESKVFKQPYHRHETKLQAGQEVVYTLPAGQSAVSFTINSTPMYEPHIQGDNPSMDRSVIDHDGNVLIVEKDMGINSGAISLGTRKEGPLYLVIKPKDFTGWVFVEYQ
jgi:hypothetical protein